MNEKFVFISHSNQNRIIAEAASHILEEYGIPCWYAPRNIVPGMTWAGSIMQAISDCAIMVLIYSKNSNESPQVANEVDNAFSAGKTIIPFLVDETPMNKDFGYYLSRKHWLIAYPDYRKKLMPLVEAVANNLGITLEKKDHIQDTLEKDINNNSHASVLDKDTRAEAVACMARNDMDTAFALLVRPAMDGDSAAQLRMREVLETRQRIRQIKEYRFEALKEAADKGNAFAQAMMCRYFVAIDVDDDEYFRYASMSAAQGDSYGILELSMAYQYGCGIPVDIARAVKLSEKAVAQGNMIALWRLARNYGFGWYSEYNPRRATVLLKDCLDAEMGDAYNILAKMYMEHRIEREKEEKIAELCKKAIDFGCPEAYQTLALLYIHDFESKKPRDARNLKKGIEVLKEGCLIGVSQCLSLMASLYNNGIGVEKNPMLAVRWHRKAALTGSKVACGFVGEAYYKGKGVEKDLAEAWKWFEKTAQMENSYGYYMLAHMCEQSEAPERYTPEDCVNFYLGALKFSGVYGAKSAMELYNIYKTPEFEERLLDKDTGCPVRYISSCEKNDEKAVDFLAQAAGRNVDADSMYLYGNILCSPDSGFSDEVEGIRFLEEAVRMGHTKAVALLKQVKKTLGWL